MQSYSKFKRDYSAKKNQVLYKIKKVKNDHEIIKLIDDFLVEKNSFIFESVEKGKIKGRYTIFGRNPDKIWEFNNNYGYLLQNKKKIKIKGNPEKLIEKIIEDFKFKTPSILPPISSLISGYFSYDSIRYIEKIPNTCKDDLKLPDVRLLRPRTLIIYDNLKKKIFYIINVFNDEKITNFSKKYTQIQNELNSLYNNNFNIKKKNNIKKSSLRIKIKSNTSKSSFLDMVKKAKSFIKIGDIFQVVLSQRFEAKLSKDPNFV